MSLLTKWLLLVLALGLLAAPGQAGIATVICTEASSGATAGDSANSLQQGGCVNSLLTTSPTLVVASDGEVGFDPFSAGYDISDAIQLNSDWGPDPNYAAAFATGFWTQLPGRYTWVLPGTTACGHENEPSCEPIAKWDFLPVGSWGVDTPSPQIILEADGITVSDVITLDNTGPNGAAAITFESDESVPEPGTLTLLGLGVGLAAAVKRLRRKAA